MNVSTMGRRAGMAGVAVVGLAVLLTSSADALARERQRSGAYTGNRGNQGTFERSVTRERGQRSTSATWEGQRGQGSREKSATWDKSTGTGTRSATTTLPDGRTLSRESTITKTGEGAYAVEGTRTGPKGNTTTVDRTVTKQEDGSYAVQSTYTGEGGKTLTTDKTVQKTESGRSVTGTYATGAGASGSFEREITHGDGARTSEGTLTSSDGKTWKRDITTSHADSGMLTRTVTTTNPEGETRTRTGIVTSDPQAIPEGAAATAPSPAPVDSAAQ